MGHAVGDVLGEAAAVAVSPIAIVAIILILATPRARLNGPLFALGWVLGLAALGAIMLAIGAPGGASADHHPATWVGALKLALGALLLLFGAREWRRRTVSNLAMTVLAAAPARRIHSASRVLSGITSFIRQLPPTMPPVLAPTRPRFHHIPRPSRAASSDWGDLRAPS